MAMWRAKLHGASTTEPGFGSSIGIPSTGV